MKPNSLHFVFVKATGGTTFIDPEFGNNWQGAREAGIVRGAYHFYYAKDDPNTQAQHFAQTVARLKEDDLPPVLDVEITDGSTKQELLEGVILWLKTVEQKLGRKPIIYTDHAFANEYLTDQRLADYVLWIANYDVPAPALPNLWKAKGWKFWQHSQKGTLDGITGSVDLNIFDGSADDLQKFIKEQQAP